MNWLIFDLDTARQYFDDLRQLQSSIVTIQIISLFYYFRCNALNDNDYGMHSSFIIKVVMSTPPDFKILPNDQTHDPGKSRDSY